MKARTLVLGVFAFWFLVVVAAFVFVGFPEGRQQPAGAFERLIARYGLEAAMLVLLVGWFIYIWDLFHNPRVPREKRALWAVVLIFVFPYSMPFYFWFYVREGKSRNATLTPGTPS